MFNFRSLAEVVGVTLEGENAGRRLSRIEAEQKAKEDGEQHEDRKPHEAAEAVEVERVEDVSVEDDSAGDSSGIERSAATLRPEVEAGDGDESEQQTRPGTADQVPTLSNLGQLTPPKLTITPDTPAPTDDAGQESKQLGYGATALEQAHQFTQ